MMRYVGKALIHVGSDSQDGDQGPFYRYLAAESLDESIKRFFEKRNTLFSGGGELGSFFLNLLNVESVYALAVKEVRTRQWYVLLDGKGEFLRQKNHQKFELDTVKEAYGERAFRTRSEYFDMLLKSPREPEWV